MMRFEGGSTNVYADLGRPDTDEMLARAQFAAQVDGVIKRLRLTRVAAIASLPKLRLSGLLHDQFHGVSEATILNCLTRLGSAGTRLRTLDDPKGPA